MTKICIVYQYYFQNYLHLYVPCFEEELFSAHLNIEFIAFKDLHMQILSSIFHKPVIYSERFFVIQTFSQPTKQILYLQSKLFNESKMHKRQGSKVGPVRMCSRVAV